MHKLKIRPHAVDGFSIQGGYDKVHFIIGSTNKAKVQAVEKALAIYFPQATLASAEVASGVSNQPFGDDETRCGAITRALGASRLKEGAIGIGLEGGVRALDEKLYICNWGAMILPDGTRLTAGGAQIPLPEEIAQEILRGKELGLVMDAFCGAKGLRHKEGAIGILTAGAVKRDELFVHVLHLLIGQWKFLKGLA